MVCFVLQQLYTTISLRPAILQSLLSYKSIALDSSDKNQLSAKHVFDSLHIKSIILKCVSEFHLENVM